ncbi:unnamed protein product [Owenia fusiformis]|uniref:orotate phosphoribosyltransferase n=1 Tax=Owenia fusiformis TaxID=6347 RepID=A0A8J1UCP5_OWEFU|nr:unnamed protein product [Owenia fusiformis]
MEIQDIDTFLLEFMDVGGIKFGDFVMRTGEHSPIYIDMRVIWSYPKLVKIVSKMMIAEMERREVKYDHICGIPYQGIPIASYISTKKDIPMLLKRQEQKNYGTKKMMEGIYKSGDKVILIDDVLMTGGTFIKNIPYFRNEGLEVTGAFCFFDRNQGGRERVLNELNVNIYSLLSLQEALEIYVKFGKITQQKCDEILQMLREIRFDTPAAKEPCLSTETINRKDD